MAKIEKMNLSSDHDSRVLILAPGGRDADLISSALREAGVFCHICNTAAGVVSEFETGVAAAVISAEALGETEVQIIASALGGQAPWSDLPIIVMTGSGEPNRARGQLATMRKLLGNVTVQERPLRAVTLVSTVQSALRAREKQYEVRDHVTALESRE
jgi:DNA-binding NtrC family response regulator